MEPPRKSILLQNRDIEILRGLFECRVMTMAQITSLYFEDRYESAKTRLQKLRRKGFITTKQQNGIFVRQLTATGLELLHNRGVLSQYPPLSRAQLERRLEVSDLTLNHELDCIEVKVAFTAALKKSPELELIRFSTWPLLHQFQGSTNNLVKPDGFLHIMQQNSKDGFRELRYFIEVDRSTESQTVLFSKVAAYGKHYRHCRREIRGGGTAAASRLYPFRVLMVFKTPERRDRMKEYLAKTDPQFATKVFLSTLEEIKSHPMTSIGF